MVKIESLRWKKDERDEKTLMQVPYSDLEKRGGGVRYVMNGEVKFRIHVTVL